jgi:hypothetical protein
MLALGAGEECLMSVVKHRAFPKSFKREAIDRVVASSPTAVAVRGQVGKLDAVVGEDGVNLEGDGAATRSSRKALAAAPVALFANRAKAYFEDRSTATKR